jgi:hypothetical protein
VQQKGGTVAERVEESKKQTPWLGMPYLLGGPEPYIYLYIQCTYNILAGKSPYIRSYTVCILRFCPTLLIWHR